MTVRAEFTCDRCGNTWWGEEPAGTLGLAKMPPGLADINHAQILHLCPGCTDAFEKWTASGLTVVRGEGWDNPGPDGIAVLDALRPGHKR